VIQARIEDFKLGWFIGNFTPVILHSTDFEVAFKTYKTGEMEVAHYQKTAVEITLVIEGQCRLGDVVLNRGDLLRLEPLEVADFEALTDCSVIAIKCPSNPSDKVVA